MTDASLTIFHAPHTRALGVAALMEEMQAPYERRVLNLQAGDQRQPEFKAVNPMGKVPAVLHHGTLVTEQPAVYQYLAELFPAAGLAPAVGDRDRGSFLRWLSFYGSCFEPALVDKALGREPAPPSMCPYGTLEGTVDTLLAQLRTSPFIAGERLTAADFLWGPGLRWITGFKLLPASPEVSAYIERVCSRPSVQKADAEDARLIAARAPA